MDIWHREREKVRMDNFLYTHAWYLSYRLIKTKNGVIHEEGAYIIIT